MSAEAGEALCNLKSDRGFALMLVALANDSPDVRFDAMYTLNRAGVSGETLLTRLAEMEATIPAENIMTRARLHCGLGTLLRESAKGWPAAEQELQQAIELASQMALPHALLGDLLMGKSSNLYRQDKPDQGFSRILIVPKVW